MRKKNVCLLLPHPHSNHRRISLGKRIFLSVISWMDQLEMKRSLFNRGVNIVKGGRRELGTHSWGEGEEEKTGWPTKMAESSNPGWRWGMFSIQFSLVYIQQCKFPPWTVTSVNSGASWVAADVTAAAIIGPWATAITTPGHWASSLIHVTPPLSWPPLGSRGFQYQWEREQINTPTFQLPFQKLVLLQRLIIVSYNKLPRHRGRV